MQVLAVASFVKGESLGGSFFLNKGLGLDFGVVHTQGWPSHLLGGSEQGGQGSYRSLLPETASRANENPSSSEKESHQPVKSVERCYFEKWESSKSGRCTAWGACRLGANVHLDIGCTADKVGAECRSVQSL